MMKKLLFTTITCSLFPFLSVAQRVNLNNGRHVKHETTIVLVGGDLRQGTLYQTKDSSLIMFDKFISSKYLSVANFYIKIVPYNKIYIIEINEKEIKPEYGLLGAIIGVIPGGLFGAVYDRKEAAKGGINFWPGLGKSVGAIIGGLVGVFIGITIGTKNNRTQFLINGDFEKFKENRDKLIECSYI